MAILSGTAIKTRYLLYFNNKLPFFKLKKFRQIYDFLQNMNLKIILQVISYHKF